MPLSSRQAFAITVLQLHVCNSGLNISIGSQAFTLSATPQQNDFMIFHFSFYHRDIRRVICMEGAFII